MRRTILTHLLMITALLSFLGSPLSAFAISENGTDKALRVMSLLKKPREAENLYAVNSMGEFDFDEDGIDETYFIILEIWPFDEHGDRVSVGGGSFLVAFKGEIKKGNMLTGDIFGGENEILDKPRALTQEELALYKKFREYLKNARENDYWHDRIDDPEFMDVTGDGKKDMIFRAWNYGFNKYYENVSIMSSHNGKWENILPGINSLYKVDYEDIDKNGTIEIIEIGYPLIRPVDCDEFDCFKWQSIYSFIDGYYMLSNHLYPQKFPLVYATYLDKYREAADNTWYSSRIAVDIREAQIFDYNGKADNAIKWYETAISDIKEVIKKRSEKEHRSQDDFASEMTMIDTLEERIDELKNGTGTPFEW